MPPSWCPGVLQEDISCEAMDTGSESSGHDEVFRDSYGEGSTEHAGVEPASKLAADLATELPRFSGGAELGQKGTRLRAGEASAHGHPHTNLREFLFFYLARLKYDWLQAWAGPASFIAGGCRRGLT